MKRTLAVFLGLSMALTMAAQERTRHIDDEMIKGFRKSAEAPFDVRFLEQDMLEVSLNQAVIDWADTSCTYRVPTSRVTDQKKS